MHCETHALTRQLRLLVVPLFALFFWTGVATADARPGFLPSDAITRGMSGYGLTVFQGTQIDTFGVEILGVLKDFRPKSDLILARLSGEMLDNTGVIQGMSGSPVYIDGKLIGAVSYSIAVFAKEPIAGITPIAAMTDMWNRTRPEGIGLNTEGRSGDAQATADVAGYGQAQIRPIGTPLVISGFATQVLAEMREELTPFGLTPVQGGAGGRSDTTSAVLEPGAAMGVQLARGDMSMTGIGTVTYREGDRVVGLGHPAYWVGSTDMPMTGAYIHDVLASNMLSFKLGVASGPVGIIDQDRASGVSGRIGGQADMIPAQIRVGSEGHEETFRVEVWRNRDFAPFVLRSAAASALFSAEKPAGRATLRASLRVSLDGRDDVLVSNIYSGPRALGGAVLGVTTPLAQLMGNSFEQVRITNVMIDLHVAEQQEVAAIASVRLAKAKYTAGDEVVVQTVLRPERGNARTVQTRLTVPGQARSGRLFVRVASARDHLKGEVKRVPAGFRPNSLDHLVRLIENVPRNDEMVVELIGPPQGVSVDGRELRGLPPSVLAALRGPASSGTVGPVRQGVLHRQRIKTDYVLSGSHTVAIAIDGDSNGGAMNGKVEARGQE
jgi:hypothetical protein